MFGLVFALGIVLVLSLVYIETARYLTHRVDRALNAEVEIFRRAGPESILRRFKQEAARDPLNTFGLFSATGDQVAGDTRLKPEDLAADRRPRNFEDRGANPERAMEAQLPWGEVLIVERDTSQLVELRRIILGALVWSGAIIVVFGLMCGVALSIRPLRRVQAFQDASDAIVSGDFAVRLPVDGSRDELDALARIVNAMVDEVERLMIQARTVGESVAHELRTPLTRLRTTLDHASRSFDDAADPRRLLLEQCVAETESVLARFQALLRIAAVEARNRRAEIAVVSLSAIVEQVAELYQPLASEREIDFALKSEAAVTARADADLMVEAVSNLVDNALKFTPPGGHVTLALTQGPSGPSIIVSDDGPGIPEPERPLVTKRFYRTRRDANVQGHGLGLSLVAAIVELHGFELNISDAAPGAVITILCRR